MNAQIYTDGGSKGNPGPSYIGVLIKINNIKIWEHHGEIGIATNNDAEYQALIKALEYIKSQKSTLKSEYQISNLNFFSDSRLMVNQVNGLFKIKNGKIKEYIMRIRILEQEISLPITYSYIPREKNTEADALVNTI